MAGGITEMLKGTLEGCVMQLIDNGDAYGYEITRQLNELGLPDVVEGTVYAILVRLEKRGLVEVEKKPSELGPPRKFYALNAEGKAELEQFWQKWEHLRSTIDQLKGSA